ncbi:hypothetical protein J2847_006435 [Azospirillum agricola]|uniref:hypothetical protein n=1 Tax=Azospirillum agricola TaxID=1720247 RepID=UPI001AE1C695|nr:hypothetical protein [Azospirillum agricola]MBP2233100.1 hypothetical protein [Azospirillum agricola]
MRTAMVDLSPRAPADGLGSSFGTLPFDVYNTRQAVLDGGVATAVWTMPAWYGALHGVAAELAFWACVLLAVGRFAWFVLDLVARFRAGRPPKP